MVPRPMTPGEWGMLLTVATLWGGSYFFTGIAVRELPVLTIVMARYVISAPLMLLIVFWLGQRRPWHRDIVKAGLILAIFNQTIPFVLIAWGQSHIPSAVASILNAAGPLVTLVMAHFMTRDEKMTGPRAIGVTIGFAGLAIMIGVSALQALNVDLLAQGACVLATASYAFANILARRFTQNHMRPTELVAAQATFAGLILLPFLLVIDQPWSLPAPSGQAWMALFGLGFLSATIGHLIFFRVLTTAGATNISLVSYFMPVSAILLGVAFLGETLQGRHVVGIVVIVLGLAIMDGRLARLLGRLRTGSAGK